MVPRVGDAFYLATLTDWHSAARPGPQTKEPRFTSLLPLRGGAAAETDMKTNGEI